MILRRFSLCVLTPLLFLTIAVCAGCPRPTGGTAEKSLVEQMNFALEEIPDPVERAEELIRIGREFVVAADMTGAKNSLDYAKQAASEISIDGRPADRARVYAELARGWAEAGNIENCDRAYDSAKEALANVDSAAEKTTTLKDLALVKVKLKNTRDAAADLKAAEAEAAKIVDLKERVDLMTWVSYAYVQMEDTDEAGRVMAAAEDLALGQSEPGKKGQLLAIVGREQVNSLSDSEAGNATLGKALEAARAVADNPYQQAETLVDVAASYVRIGNSDTAREILDEAENVAGGRAECKPILERIEEIRSTEL